MNWLQSIIFGLISGISEFMPISSAAHKRILLYLFGVEALDPVRELIVHIAALAALMTAARSLIDTVSRERKLVTSDAHIYNRRYRSNMDLRLVRSASISTLIGYLIIRYTVGRDFPLSMTALMLLLNGVILFIPGRMLRGNKDARSMSDLDGFLIGLGGALSALPGASRIGISFAVASARGADRKHAVNWVYLVSVPAFIMLISTDIISILAGFGSISLSAGFMGYVLIGIFTYISAFIAVSFLKNLCVHNDLSVFSYYCWGASLFTFILYLI